MGAWAVGNFDNDDALDWTSDLSESKGSGAIRSALKEASSEGYLEAPVACAALAAAEVVAALLGNPSPSLPDEVREWIKHNRIEVDHDLLSLARAAVIRVKEKSELHELWQDSKDYTQWQALEDDLLERLGAG
jgi:hypothetical protein